jgi:peptidylprolyl isomerase
LSIAVLLVIGGASALLIIDPLGWFDKKPAVVEEPTRDGSSLGFDARVGDTSRNREAAVVVAATNNGTLEIIDITVGSGAQVTRGDTITVDYVGYLVDGTVFDTSIGREPFEVEIGIGYLIEGFDEGLLGMKEGGRRVLVIPAGMAYGSEESSYIPANSLLVFDVELLAVK